MISNAKGYLSFAVLVMLYPGARSTPEKLIRELREKFGTSSADVDVDLSHDTFSIIATSQMIEWVAALHDVRKIVQTPKSVPCNNFARVQLGVGVPLDPVGYQGRGQMVT